MNVAVPITVVTAMTALGLPYLRGVEGISADVGSIIGAAALVALGTSAGWMLGLLAVVVGLTLPAEAAASTHMLGVALGGAVALGGLGRVFAQAGPHLMTQGNRFAAVWLLALGVAAIAMPDTWVTAFDGDGKPLIIAAVAKDAGTGLRSALQFEGLVPYASHAASLTAWFPYLSLIAGLGLLVPWGTRKQRTWAWLGPILPAAFLLFSGLAGLLEQLLAEPFDVQPADWVAAVNRAGGGNVFVEFQGEMPEAFLGLGSRPVIDGLRIMVGGLLAALCARSMVLEGARGASLPSRSQPWAMVAILGTVIAAFFAEEGQQVALVGTLVVLVGSLVAAQFGHVSKRAPYGGLILAFAYHLFALAGPAVGWLNG